MKAVIALEKKEHVFHHKNITYEKGGTLSLRYMLAVLPIARVRHLKRNLESAFAQLITRARFR